VKPVLSAVKTLLERSGIGVEVPCDITREIWWKFMLNVGINQTSAVLRAPYGVYQKSESARSLMRNACMEVLNIAQKKKINLTNEDIDNYFRIINGLAANGKTSMLQDVEAGRGTEVETFAGAVIRMGKELDIPTPVNEILYAMIKTIEGTYESSILFQGRNI
jgi:2-dehydropantoate 2-reductase